MAGATNHLPILAYEGAQPQEAKQTSAPNKSVQRAQATNAKQEILRVVESLIEGKWSRESVKDAIRDLKPLEVEEALEERSLAGLCGAPWCTNGPREGGKRARFHWDALRKDVVDAFEENAPVPLFCSDRCAQEAKALLDDKATRDSQGVRHGYDPHGQRSSSNDPSDEGQEGGDDGESPMSNDVIERTGEQVGKGESVWAPENPQGTPAFVFDMAGEGAGKGGLGERQNTKGQEVTAMETFSVGELKRNVEGDGNGDDGVRNDADLEQRGGQEVGSDDSDDAGDWSDPFQGILDMGNALREEDKMGEPPLSTFGRVATLLNDIASEEVANALCGRSQMPIPSHPPSEAWISSFKQALSLHLPAVARRLGIQKVVPTAEVEKRIATLVTCSAPRRALPGLRTGEWRALCTLLMEALARGHMPSLAKELERHAEEMEAIAYEAGLREGEMHALRLLLIHDRCFWQSSDSAP